jgi:hypothetical protein
MKPKTKKHLPQLTLLMVLSMVAMISSCKKSVDIPSSASLSENYSAEARDYQKLQSVISHILAIKCKLKDLSITDFLGKKEESSTSEILGIGLNEDKQIQNILPDGDTINILIDYNENLEKVNSRSLTYCFLKTTGKNSITGRITYKINGPQFFLDSGMSCNVVIENVEIDNNKANGMITIVNTGQSSYSISTQHFKIVADGKTAEIVDGLYTKTDNGDCSYKLTGYASIVSSVGRPFTAIITDTILVSTECKWKLVAGEVELNVQNRTTKSIDFGEGNCDPFATITVEGKKIPIVF